MVNEHLTPEKRCRRCGMPILRLDTTERTSNLIWHEEEGTCIDRLRMRIAELERDNGELRRTLTNDVHVACTEVRA